MSYEQKEAIERAIYQLRSAADQYAKTGQETDYTAIMQAQNTLYDAIGGMTDYKFIV